MLYELLLPLKDWFFGFNVIRYITFRSAMAAIFSMLISIWLGPVIIRWMYSIKVGQPIRKEDCLPLYAIHKDKQGTPTMGGVIILIGVIVSGLLWTDLSNKYVWCLLAIASAFGAIGFYDDYLKIKRKNSKGYRARNKFWIECVLGLGLAVFLYFDQETGYGQGYLSLPFFKNWAMHLGWVYFPFVIFVLVGSCNGVNLTDGLDGLSIGAVTICALAFTGIAYVSGHYQFAHYLNIPFIPGAGELAILCASMAGAGLGFLWYNTYPAQIFMGDVGSLSLGAILGAVALILRKELMYLVIGGVFVIETMSVILQVASFRWTGKRIFKMSPLHHHFELKGWPEPKVTVRFWILAIIFALAGLSMLKLK